MRETRNPAFVHFVFGFGLNYTFYLPSQRSLLHSTTEHWFAKLRTFEHPNFTQKPSNPSLTNQNGSSWGENADPIGARRSDGVWLHDSTRYQVIKNKIPKFWHPGIFSLETSISQKATSPSMLRGEYLIWYYLLGWRCLYRVESRKSHQFWVEHSGWNDTTN